MQDTSMPVVILGPEAPSNICELVANRKLDAQPLGWISLDNLKGLISTLAICFHLFNSTSFGLKFRVNSFSWESFLPNILIYIYIYMHINIIRAAISKWLIIGMWIGEWLILPETVNHRHSWGLSCSWYVHPIKSIFSMKNVPKNDLWAPDPARHGTARREGAMLVARLESWRKANVNRPIHGEAGKKRKNLPPVTLKKWWVVLEYSGTKKNPTVFWRFCC